MAKWQGFGLGMVGSGESDRRATSRFSSILAADTARQQHARSEHPPFRSASRASSSQTRSTLSHQVAAPPRPEPRPLKAPGSTDATPPRPHRRPNRTSGQPRPSWPVSEVTSATNSDGPRVARTSVRAWCERDSIRSMTKALLSRAFCCCSGYERRICTPSYTHRGGLARQTVRFRAAAMSVWEVEPRSLLPPHCSWRLPGTAYGGASRAAVTR